MLHVLGCITEQHDIRLVLLAAVLCLFACATAMSMIARGRAAMEPVRTAWLVAAGVVAGCGIWGLHFVAMLAYRPGLPMAYDAPLTALSVLIAVTLCAVGFRVCLSAAGGAVGGVITGCAISAMHYVGMAAVRVPAHGVWDVHYVVASLLVGILATAFGLHIAVRRNDMKGYVAAASLFAVGIVGMHFTAMSAVVYVPDPTVRVTGVVIAPAVLAIAVAASVVLIMALGMIGAVVDYHLAGRATKEAQRLRDHIEALEATKRQLEETTDDLGGALAAADAANAAKSLFLATMSHELRTPLNAVIGFSEMLQIEAFGPLGHERYHGYADDIHASGAHLLGLINDVLDIARIDSGQVDLDETNFAVLDLVDGAVRMILPHAAKAQVRLDYRVAPGLPELVADRRRLRQVLINLVSNAIKFTPAGGHILVMAEPDESGLRITVQDNGIGIAAQDIPKAFERFGQVDGSFARKYDGVGLGLPLARDLVELHGGRLTLESVPGAGTMATIILPESRLARIPASEAA
ncbi:MAG: MHYT domain-containing protein [Rhizomicrobium sp.]